MAKNTLKQKIGEILENEKKFENIQIQPWECDSLAGMSMVETPSTSLPQFSGWDGMHRKKGHRRSSWPWVPLEKLMIEWEQMREWENLREYRSQEVRKERGEGGFCRERKKKELWRIWRDEGDEENEEEKETVGNHWEKWKSRNIPDRLNYV